MLYGEINNVYEKADQVLKLKIRSQLKGTGIELKDFWEVSDLANDKKFYLIGIEKIGIRFQNVNEFYTKFLGLVKFKIEENAKEIKDIEYHIEHDRYPDLLYAERDSLYSTEFCLDKLKIRLEKLIVKSPKQESPKHSCNLLRLCFYFFFYSQKVIYSCFIKVCDNNQHL